MRRTSTITVIGLLGVALLASCHGRGAAGAPETSAPAAPALSPEQFSYLSFGRVAAVMAPDVADLGGTIEFDEQHTARLSPVVPGRVSELLVQVGDRVSPDQPLVALDSPEVKATEAEFVRAEADLILARRAAERAERLRAAGAIAEKDYLEAQEERQKATADFERARAQRDRLRIPPDDGSTRYLVRAPFAGTVVERKALVGMEVGAEGGEPLVVVSDLSVVRVVLRLPERQLPLVRAGQGVRVRVDGAAQEFHGEVTVVGDVVDDATQTVPVRCTVPNPDHLLKPAMFARVTLEAAAGAQLVAVPVEALVSDGERFQVVVRRADGSLEVRRVEVGVEVDGLVQVTSGVGPGDEIVTGGALFAARALASS